MKRLCNGYIYNRYFGVWAVKLREMKDVWMVIFEAMLDIDE